MSAVAYLAIAALALLIAAVAAIFIIGNRSTVLAHARVTVSDVENALNEVVSPDSEYHDAWRLFLSWPVGDPELESFRQQCLEIVRNDSPPPGRDLSYGAEREIRALLQQIRLRRSREA
ncbi:MAG TPA: hypothetical protein VFV51_18055 [Vicinamibacterales bacterium]|nr:hypothetical protein [Vicinamibacterales bacterium]